MCFSEGRPVGPVRIAIAIDVSQRVHPSLPEDDGQLADPDQYQ